MIIGLVGKPSAGKSSFFKAATLSEVLIANYPFATITPNSGIGFVSIACIDKELGVQCNPRFGACMNHERFIPIELLDVAGIVEGAHEGKGMGNAFLDDLNQADALIHIVDISGSENERGEPCEALSFDPAKDIAFLEEELNMWYLRILNKGWDKISRSLTHDQKEVAKAITKQMSGLRVTQEIAEETLRVLNLPAATSSWTAVELKKLATYLREQTKPLIIAANKVDIPGADKNYERVKTMFPQYVMIPCSSVAEIALKEAAKKDVIEYIPGHEEITIKGTLSDQQKAGIEYIQKNVLQKFHSTGIQHVLNAVVFDILKYKAIYPGGVTKLEDKDGNVLPDCFLLPGNATALDFAFKLHTDIGKGFIKAIDVKTKLPVGKDHMLKHRDVIEIKTNA